MLLLSGILISSCADYKHATPQTPNEIVPVAFCNKIPLLELERILNRKIYRVTTEINKSIGEIHSCIYYFQPFQPKIQQYLEISIAVPLTQTRKIDSINLSNVDILSCESIGSAQDESSGCAVIFDSYLHGHVSFKGSTMNQSRALDIIKLMRSQP